jgi:hypothetical protein
VNPPGGGEVVLGGKKQRGKQSEQSRIDLTIVILPTQLRGVVAMQIFKK